MGWGQGIRPFHVKFMLSILYSNMMFSFSHPSKHFIVHLYAIFGSHNNRILKRITEMKRQKTTKRLRELLIVSMLMFPTLFPMHLLGQGTVGGKMGKGMNFMAEDSSFSMKFSARIQTLYEGKYILTDDATVTDKYGDKFLIRRARLKLEGFGFSPKITYKMELGLTNKDHGGKPIAETNYTSNLILDAKVDWEFSKGWKLVIGQTKLPGNRERVVSSQALQFVDRSIANAEYNIDRDMGLQIHGSAQLGNVVVRPIASVAMGEGRDITSSNSGGYDYTGRIEVLPMGAFASKGDYFHSDLKREEKPKLAFGFTYDFNDDASREQGTHGSFLSETRDITAMFGDMIFKYNGFSLAAEYCSRSIDNPLITDTLGNVLAHFVSGSGISMQAGYLLQNNLEVAARYSTATPEKITGDRSIKETTLGLSRYFSGHKFKLQGDVTLVQEETKDDALRFRMQMEFGF